MLRFRSFRLAHLAFAAALVGIGIPVAGHAEPGGCLKYGAVGAVGGHLAHHGVLGAAGGCAAGMWKRHEYRKDVRDKARAYDQEHRPDGQTAPNGGPGPGPAPDNQDASF